MRYGLILSGGGTGMQEMVEIARRADAAGIDAIYLTEAWRSGFVGLAAIAMATQRIEIGPCILNAYGRSPWLTAMSAVDLDELSGGRLVLGVGTGNRHINEEWQGIPQSRPLRKMEEYVTLLRKAVAARMGERVVWQGEIHSMDWTPSVQPLRASIPVTMAAIFPGMLEVAGRVADGIAMGALLAPGYIADRVLPRFRDAALAAGRDPDALLTNTAPFVSMHADREVARQAAREAICHLYSPLPHPYYDHALREQGFARAADAATRHVAAGRMEHALEAFTDDVVDAVTVCGTPDDCRAALARFEGVVDLVSFVNVSPPTHGPLGVVSDFDALIELGRGSAPVP